jgi:hypothetical protein
MSLNERFRQFELECSIKCQTYELREFCNWLRNTYSTQHEFLINYAIRKIQFDSTNGDINLAMIEITNYIYHKYKYNYQSGIQTDNSEVDDLPELDEIDNRDDLQLLRDMEIEEAIYTPEEIMTAALINDIRSGLLFYDIMNRIRSEVNINRKFNIESIVEGENEKNMEEEKECNICFDIYKKDEFVTFNCKHEFCKTCVKKTIQSDKRPHPCCGYCRGKICKLTSRKIEVQTELSELII